MITIWLFWTCWKSKWRDSFIEKYKSLWIDFFNPQLEEWTWSPENAIIEAEHLASDDIILFPVTWETYWLWSLAETWFSILQTLKNINSKRFVIIYIDDLDDELKVEEKLYIESIKWRRLVLEHLAKINNDNVFIVSSLDAMKELSLELYRIIDKFDYLHKKYKKQN